MAKPQIKKTVGIYERPEKGRRNVWLLVALALALAVLVLFAVRQFMP